jgi:exonuclease SbcC
LITHLSYHVRFRQTGRVLSNSLDLGQGITAIVGPNEAGKSFVVEMIRYAFFGSTALRGVAEDYEELRVKMTWGTYEIERTPKGGKVLRGGEVLATGTRSLNAKVIEVLGFGLDVFDVSCVCNQGDVERLGAMPAAERKAMVDRVIGAARIDEVQRWAGEQQTLLVREVAVLERGLVAPTEPARPEGYRPPVELRGLVDQLRRFKQKHDELVGWLRATRAAPVEPVKPEGNEIQLKDELDDARFYEAEVKRIKALTVVDFDADEVTRQWEAFVLWTQRYEFEQRHPRPTMTPADLAEKREERERFEKLKVLQREKERLQEMDAAVVCPHCNTGFCIEHDRLAEVEAKITALAPIEGVPMTTLMMDREQARQDDWAHRDTIATWELLKDAPRADAPVISQAQLAKARQGGHVSSTERDEMLAGLRVPAWASADVQRALDSLHRYRLAHEAYVHEKAAYDAWYSEKHEKECQLHDLSLLIAELPELEALLRACESYDMQLTVYEKVKADYDLRQAELEAKRADVTGWKAARGALGDVKTRIKTYLVPSLSRVASSLLNQMTDGQRSSVIVDEEFNITIDGQRLETLSGSGKAVANLALRIALGQVLTNKVVSLFIGDEIDASMDEVRAAATHSSIRSLSGQILQIVLITHKIPEADNTVTLGTTSYGDRPTAEAA